VRAQADQILDGQGRAKAMLSAHTHDGRLGWPASAPQAGTPEWPTAPPRPAPPTRALWAYGPREFEAFDDTATALLRRGLQRSLILRALAPAAVIRNLTAAAATTVGAADVRIAPGRRH
jgi:hypothetical protein